MGIYYPSFDGLKKFHMCNHKCHIAHFSYGFKHIHYFTKGEDNAIEQSIDDFIESQVDERKFVGGR